MAPSEVWSLPVQSVSPACWADLLPRQGRLGQTCLLGRPVLSCVHTFIHATPQIPPWLFLVGQILSSGPFTSRPSSRATCFVPGLHQPTWSPCPALLQTLLQSAQHMNPVLPPAATWASHCPEAP